MGKLIILELGLKEDKINEDVINPYMIINEDIKDFIDEEDLKEFQEETVKLCKKIFNNIKK